MASARKSARGTVRGGSATSPLGTSATSTPTNAKMSRMAVRPMSDTDGNAGQTRYSRWTAHSPATTNTTSGMSLAAVTASTSPAPTETPRTFAIASTEKSAARRAARPTPAPAAAHTTPMDPANALATDATAADAISQNSTPARKPTKGPNATST